MIDGLDGAARRNFTLVTIANFLFFCCFSSFFLLPIYITRLGGDEARIGFIMGSFGVTSIASIPLVAFLIDRFGRRRFMLLGASLMLASSLGYLLVTELNYLLYALRLAQGVGFAFFFTSAGTAAADFVPESQRGRGLGLFGAFTIASYALGPSAGELVIESFGFRSFFIYASSFAAAALLITLLVKDASFTPSKDRYGTGFFRLALSRRLAVPLLANLILAGGFGSVLNFISAYLKPKGVDVFYFFLTYTIVVAAIRLCVGGISDKLGRKKIAAPSLFFLSIAIASMTLMDSVYSTILISLVFSASYGMLYPTLSALVIDKAASDERGKAMGAFNACFSVGTNILTLGFGLIARRFGFEGMYIASAALVFAGFLIFMVFERGDDCER
ncbi:MAG: MFS transporter [Deltaproteobacteria bacterium]